MKSRITNQYRLFCKSGYAAKSGNPKSYKKIPLFTIVNKKLIFQALIIITFPIPVAEPIIDL